MSDNEQDQNKPSIEKLKALQVPISNVYTHISYCDGPGKLVGRKCIQFDQSIFFIDLLTFSSVRSHRQTNII